MRLSVMVEYPDGTDLLDLGAAIVASFRRAVDEDRPSGTVRDANGNMLGEWLVEPGDEPTRQEIEVGLIVQGDTVVDIDGSEYLVSDTARDERGAVVLTLHDGQEWFFLYDSHTLDVLR